jgi:hypothetical protein
MAKRMDDRCCFCERILSEEERTKSHGLCHKCFWLRRIVKRAQKAGDRVVLPDPEEKTVVRWLSEGLK